MPVESSSPEPRITVLYLLYPQGSRYDRARPLAELERMLNRLPGKKTVIEIDNSDEQAPDRQLSGSHFAIGGDNRRLEFSGWQRGLQFARGRKLPSDLYLFANDTFQAQSGLHRRMLNRDAVACAVGRQALVGKRMTMDATGTILGNPLIPYVRTHLFLMGAALAEELESLIGLSDEAVGRILMPRYEPEAHLFRDDAPVSESIRRYILFHLQQVWHRKMPYNAENFAALRGKAISILNALLLSIRTQALGYPLVDLAASARVMRENTPLLQLRAEWAGAGREASAAGRKPRGGYWQSESPVYRHVPLKQRSFSLENVVDFLERRENPEHL